MQAVKEACCEAWRVHESLTAPFDIMEPSGSESDHFPECESASETSASSSNNQNHRLDSFQELIKLQDFLGDPEGVIQKHRKSR